jgi:hypothetical protein
MGDMQNSDICVIWQTHRLDAASLEEYERLEKDCQGKFDTLVLYDNSRGDFEQPASHPTSEFSMFDIKELAKKYNLNHFREPVSITPGNTIFPLLDFAHTHPYSYYWLIEYDVRYTGSWRELFTYFSSSKSDLLGTTLYRHQFRPSWCWWSSLRKPRFSIVRQTNWIRGLFPVLRISAQGLQVLHKANRKGWKGHYEVLMPTALYHYGLTLEDFGGDGEFVDEENKNRFYTNTPLVDGLGPGTFVCPPSQPVADRLPNKLYHAVK